MIDNQNNVNTSSSTDHPSRRDLLTTEIIEKWTQEQIELRKNLKLYDTEPWQIKRKIYSKNDPENDNDNAQIEMSNFTNTHLRYVAGMDISFVKNDTLACSGLFVFDLSDGMKLVYEDLDHDDKLIHMDQPYVPGFLAYREAPFLLKKLDKLKREKPWFYPHCIFIDGNGVLHANKFGMACHIGLLSDTPTIGCSKKLFQVFGLENSKEHKEKIITQLKKGGDYFELTSNDENSHELLGYCYRPTNTVTNPIYVSIGHKISWETCLWILKVGYEETGWRTRVPEPIRQADILTREYLRKNGFE